MAMSISYYLIIHSGLITKINQLIDSDCKLITTYMPEVINTCSILCNKFRVVPRSRDIDFYPRFMPNETN